MLAAGKWYSKILDLKQDYGKVDLYYAGYNDYRGGIIHRQILFLNYIKQNILKIFLDGIWVHQI